MDLWAAAPILNEWCSTDGFIDFRQWLIGRGEAVYRAALEDPDTLVDAVEPPPPGTYHVGWYMCEHLRGVAEDAYREKGEAMYLAVPEDENEWADFPDLDFEPPPLRAEPWEYRDLPQKLPRLWAAFRGPIEENGVAPE